jgi:hypothetical protein
LVALMMRVIWAGMSSSLSKAARAPRLAGLRVGSTAAGAARAMQVKLSMAARAVRHAIGSWLSIVMSVAQSTGAVGGWCRRRIWRARSRIAGWAKRTSWHRAVLYATAAAAVMVSVVLLASSLGERGSPAPRRGPQEATGTSQAKPPLSAPQSVAVPSLIGMTAFEAHERLAEVGLAVLSAQPVQGTSGIVVRTYPDPGVHVAPGTAITLFVGAPPGRLPDSG